MRKLLNFFMVVLVLLVCAVLFTTCQREYSYEGGNTNITSGSAVYTLNGAGGSCTGSVLTGKYFKGTSLSSANTVQLLVDVTTIGTYSITTNTANGISFSTSGTFANTGSQTIILTGNGTPKDEGTFNFTVPVGLGCSFTVVVEAAPAAMASFILAGAPNDCENAKIYGNYIASKALNNTNNVEITVNVTAPGAFTISTDTLDGISFSASGAFTTLGNQKVTLLGAGTPKLPRNLQFTPLSGVSSCTFPITVVNAGTLATYVLESGFGNPNPCIYTVSGAYTTNMALSDSNTVSMRVFVSEVGNFTIATNTVNGMTFSYTGAFTTTGTQYIILKGSGTPVKIETTTFTPEIVGPHPLGGEFCSFDINVK